MSLELQEEKNGHIGNPETCPRCCVSARPPCPVCGHSLSGAVNENKSNSTTCEVCGNVAYIPNGESKYMQRKRNKK